ncbi:MAG: 4-hydroxy-3-methylbut-2-enyl diphosphate reductase [Candidatus Omnitrophota bacterium]
MLKINLANSAGFCFGVRRALDIALKTANANCSVYMLGDIVHNEDVVRQIEKAGIKKIGWLKAGKDRILLIRAHGTGRAILQRAGQLGYKIVDATCPMVKEIHKIARDMENKGYKIVIIGDKFHDEVLGIAGQLRKKAVIIDGLKHIPRIIAKKTAVVVQSTQNLEEVLKILKVLKSRVKTLKFYNTICQPTRFKQREIRAMPLHNDAMVIIGSRTSANTRRLYEISKSINPKTYWVNSPRDLKPRWFRNVQSVGVTAGASTPGSTTNAVIKKINTRVGGQ